MRTRTILCIFAFSLVLSPTAAARDFEAGSLIIPMDTTYQDTGMFKAFGLVYQLLLNDIPVYWTIKSGKAVNGIDFNATGKDSKSDAVVDDHGYRGGPFVVDKDDADDALAVIKVFADTTDHPFKPLATDVAVHITTLGFSAEVSRKLVAAPTIAMIKDGHESIARKYMQAAMIPDSTGDLAWPDDSPDMMEIGDLAGTSGNDRDGSLFEQGKPKYCQLMTMHFDIKKAENNPDMVKEVREYLKFPTHFFAECQAVNAFENAPNGLFLTDTGFNIFKDIKKVKFFNADSPFGQLDGVTLDNDGYTDWVYTKAGSEPAYDVKTTYKVGGITMITRSDTDEGSGDVWMTGFLDGTCPPEAEECGSLGKISYLGGHEYDVKLPFSENPKSRGTKLFLNSLFEAPCSTEKGQPKLEITKTGPGVTGDDTITYTINLGNIGTSVANDVVVTDTLDPAKFEFVSASDPGVFKDGVVTWDFGPLAGGDNETATLTVKLKTPNQIYSNMAVLTYRNGLNEKTVNSNAFETNYNPSLFEPTPDVQTNPDTSTGGDQDSPDTGGNFDSQVTLDGSGTDGSGTQDLKSGDSTTTGDGQSDSSSDDVTLTDSGNVNPDGSTGNDTLTADNQNDDGTTGDQGSNTDDGTSGNDATGGNNDTTGGQSDTVTLTPDGSGNTGGDEKSSGGCTVVQTPISGSLWLLLLALLALIRVRRRLFCSL